MNVSRNRFKRLGALVTAGVLVATGSVVGLALPATATDVPPTDTAPVTEVTEVVAETPEVTEVVVEEEVTEVVPEVVEAPVTPEVVVLPVTPEVVEAPVTPEVPVVEETIVVAAAPIVIDFGPQLPLFDDPCGPNNVTWTAPAPRNDEDVWLYRQVGGNVVGDLGFVEAYLPPGYQIGVTGNTVWSPVWELINEEDNVACPIEEEPLIVIDFGPQDPIFTDPCGPNNVTWTAPTPRNDEDVWLYTQAGGDVEGDLGFVFASVPDGYQIGVTGRTIWYPVWELSYEEFNVACEVVTPDPPATDTPPTTTTGGTTGGTTTDTTATVSDASVVSATGELAATGGPDNTTQSAFNLLITALTLALAGVLAMIWNLTRTRRLAAISE